MAETKMSVTLLAHTQLSEKYFNDNFSDLDYSGISEGQAVALTAIRTCYSANKPSEIVAKESKKYFGRQATDGEGGTEADRLIRHIVRSKHVSTLEHLSFTFAIEGVSRALLAQLTRHRAGFSFSVQSQRYVRLGSNDRSGGMVYIVPKSVENVSQAKESFECGMAYLQDMYDSLRNMGITAEDARAVLPNAAATNLVMTANLTALLGFYAKRRPGNGAQAEIADLAVALKDAVISVEPWTRQFFEMEAK